MPRQARMLSESGIYHVTFRGIDKMVIFKNKADRSWFLTLLLRTKADGEFSLYAYCLMNNHVHLLLRAYDPLQRIMKRICGPYAQYFNKKYDRVGHLFQGRYHSQVIDSERYFLTCARYIHRNPVTAGLSPCAQEFPWSSFPLYVDLQRPSALVEKDFLYSILSPIKADAVKTLISFTDAIEVDEGDFSFLEPMENTDPQPLIKEILSRFGLTVTNFSKAPRELRKHVLTIIFTEVDISGRALAKILNISRQVIYKLK